jgi:molybdopterin-guanine dinucleotide biosynthesis protein A
MDAMPTTSAIASDDITGLVLCGGRGTRMGGVDKGLQSHQGMPLALHALLRLQGQVGHLMVNANRNLAAYESMGVPVWPDALPDFPGPLAGWLAGLERCETPYLMTLPCDTPGFPLDLVPRLAQALMAENADIAMVTTWEDGRLQQQPVFCLLKCSLMESLVAFLHSGERKITDWTARHRCALVTFDDAGAFFNANTLADLQHLAGDAGRG